MMSYNKVNEVTIIILNWNGWKDTIECLESLYRIDYPNYNVIVIDNGSEDDSIKVINEYCDGNLEPKSDFFEYNLDNKPIKVFESSEDKLDQIQNLKSFLPNERLILIRNYKNYGFAEGNNIGIRYALKYLNSDYILLLNNDTVVDKLFLNYMVEVSEKDSEIGVLGPKIYYYEDGKRDVASFEGGKISFFKGEASHISDNKEFLTHYNVDYVEGSCFLIKKQVIKEIGFLDKEYFLYWEETDWCTRIKKAGYKLMHVPEAKIWHKVGISISKTTLYYITRNRFLFMKKNSNKLQMLSFLLYFFLFKLWIRLFTLIFHDKEPQMIKYFFKGIKDGLRILIK